MRWRASEHIEHHRAHPQLSSDPYRRRWRASAAYSKSKTADSVRFHRTSLPRGPDSTRTPFDVVGKGAPSCSQAARPSATGGAPLTGSARPGDRAAGARHKDRRGKELADVLGRDRRVGADAPARVGETVTQHDHAERAGMARVCACGDDWLVGWRRTRSVTSVRRRPAAERLTPRPLTRPAEPRHGAQHLTGRRR